MSDFAVGNKICLINNASKTGTIIDGPLYSMRDNREYYNVIFDDGSNSSMYPSQLRLYEENLSFRKIIEQGMFSDIGYIKQTLLQCKINECLSNVFYSYGITNTDFYSYQFIPVLKIINSVSNSLLIADEVGLGKTIEAGLIWTELKIRNNYKKFVVVCPKSLVTKWQLELKNKFSIDAEILNTTNTIEKLSDTKFAKTYIVSYPVLNTAVGTAVKKEKIKQKKNNVLVEESDVLNSCCIDLLVVDEAHKIRNESSKSYQCISEIRKYAENVVFLSATPINNSNYDLAVLLNLLDPVSFKAPNKKIFKKIFSNIIESNSKIIKIRDDVRYRKYMYAKDIVRALQELKVQESKKGTFLNESHQLINLINKLNSMKTELTTTDCVTISNDIDEINYFSYIINKSLKRDVIQNRPVRTLYDIYKSMSEYEEYVYNKITRAILKYADDNGISSGFLKCQTQRALSSAMYPTLMYLKNKGIIYSDYEDEDLDEDEYEKNKKQNQLFSEFLAGCVKELLKETPNLLQDIFDNDTKYKELKNIINNIQCLENTEVKNKKVILFSSFKRTIDYLEQRLTQDGIKCKKITGDITDINQRTDIIEEFEKDDSQVFLSTEVGTEGIDLQFCQVLINYDMPWNPMRIEQRIGRIDRIGQEAKGIFIYNMLHKNTIDNRVWLVVKDKYNDIVQSVGCSEEILGKGIEKVSEILFNMTDEQCKQQDLYTLLATENVNVISENLLDNSTNLFALGDIMLDNLTQKGGNDKNDITSSDLQDYVSRSLDYFYSIKTAPVQNIELSTENQIEVDINLLYSFVDDYRKYCVEHSCEIGNLGNVSVVRCRFGQKHIGNISRKTEFINIQSPLIQFLKDKWKAELKKDKKLVYPVAVVNLKKTENTEKRLILIGISLVYEDVENYGKNKISKLLYAGYDITNAKEQKLQSGQVEEIVYNITNGICTDLENKDEIDLKRIASISDQISLDTRDMYDEENEKIIGKKLDIITNKELALKKNLEMQKAKQDEQREKMKEKGTWEKVAVLFESKWKIEKEKIEKQLKELEENKSRVTVAKRDLCFILIKEY